METVVASPNGLQSGVVMPVISGPREASELLPGQPQVTLFGIAYMAR